MAATKVLIKSNNAKTCTKVNLLIICEKFKIKITKVTSSGSNFNLFCVTFSEAEKLFNVQVLTSLSDGGFTPVLPAQLKSNRSVIIRKIDSHIFDNTEALIKTELINCNSWCTVGEIIKFNNSIKIVFTSSEMADKCLSVGLSMFRLHIPGYNITKDRFVNLDICFSCYAIEDHISSNCPQKRENPSFKVCSKCADAGHNYRTCEASPNSFKCVNCDGNHHALAMACPVR